MESLHHDITKAAFEALFQSVVDAYLVITTTGSIVRANRRAEILIEALHGKPVPELPTLAAVVGDANQSMLLAELATGTFSEPVRRTIRVLASTENIVHAIDISIAPFCVENGALAGALITLRDITDSVVASAQLAAIGKNLPGVVFRYRLNTDGTDEVLFLSEGSMRLWGLTPQECTQDVSLIWARIYPDDRSMLYQSVVDSAAGLTPWKVDWRVVAPDGSIRWHRGSGTPSRTADGGTQWDSIVVDVTEEHEARIRAEEANNQYQEILGAMEITKRRLQQAVDIAQLGYWHLDIESATLTWSNETYALAGVDPSTFHVTLASYIGLIHPDDRKAFQEAHAQAQRRGGNQDIEHRIVRPDGSVRWLRIRGRSTTDIDTGRRIVHGTIQDITAWQQTLHQLQEAYDRFEKVTEATQDAIWDWDIERNTLYWGGGFKKLFGYDVEKVTPTLEAWTSHLHPNDVDAVMTSLTNVVESSTTTSWQAEYRYKRQNGTYAFVIDRGVVMRDASGRAIRMVGAMTDISERRDFEESLEVLNRDLKRRATELASSNASLEQFAYVASHDLQEPLRMITSFLSILEKRYANVLDERGQQYIHFAVDGAKRMRRIILDLLAFSRAEKSDEQRTEFDMADVVQEVLLLQQALIHEKGATVNVGALPSVRGFRTPLVQVMQNLVSNALKYAKPGEPPLVNISAEEHGHEWEFVVEDNGVGIDSEYFRKIFVMFQRLQSRNESSGTGMGLAIVKKIVEHHDGRIWVESVPDVGSAFHFTIPKV